MVKSSLRRKFVIIFSIVIFIIIIILQRWNYKQSLERINQDELLQVQQLQNSIEEKMNEQVRVAKHSLIPILYNENIRQLFAERNRKGLQEVIEPGFTELKENGISQLQFHLVDATSFLRVHDPTNYGDDLSRFRYTVVAANEQKEMIEGLEQGVAGYGFRVVAPVIYNNEHIGSVEVGTDFGIEFLQRVKTETVGEYFIYSFESDEESIASTIDGKDVYPISQSIIEQVQQSGETTYIHSQDKNNLITIVPFTDYKGDIVGYIKGVISRVEIVNDLKKTTILTGSASLISIVIMMVISFFVINSITQPIRKVALGMNAVAKKDLTVEKIPIKSKDELALLANSLDTMVNNLRATLITINEASDQVAASSQQLMASSEETSGASESVAKSAVEAAESTEEQLQSVHDVIQIVAEMTSGMAQMSNDSNELISKTESVNESINSGNQSVTDIVYQMNEIHLSVDQLGAVIDNLNKRANEIDNIVNFITDISDQTNLLALNAAIEAARAGESGQGFAVVADEVRKLAEQSSESTAQITDLIKAIQHDTEYAVNMIKENMGKVNEGIDKTNGVKSSFELIESTISEVNEFTGQVANTVNKLSEGSYEIERAVERIKEAAEANSIVVHENSAASEEQMAAIQQISASSEHLAKLAEDLRSEINTFKL